MLEIAAYLPEEGWAYVRDGETLRLVGPPFASAARATVPESTLLPAVTKFGFRVANGLAPFANWDDVIAFLDAEVVRSRQERGLPPIKDDAAEQLLQYAPPDVLQKFLHRIETELIPNGKWEHAARLLRAMRNLPAESKRLTPGCLDQPDTQASPRS